MSTTTDWLGEHQGLMVKQKKEWGEVLLGWETRNRYEIKDASGNVLLMAGELPRGFLWVVLRQQIGSWRPFTIELRDNAGNLWLTVHRPWRWWLSYAEITDADGRLLGSLQQRFAVFRREFDVFDAAGQPLASITGGCWKPWTFEIASNGAPLGVIRKRWGGALKEIFTDADSFGIEFGQSMAVDLRAICLGATFLFDFAYFERRG